jgi:hypothetical protein
MFQAKFNAMKKIFLPLIILFAVLLNVSGQNSGSSNLSSDDKNAFSVQILKHALGVDYERKIYKNFGLALSAGLAGAEIEAKYHLKPQINSPSIGFSTGYVWYSVEDISEGKAEWETSRINMFFFEYRTQKRLVFTVGAGWFDYQDKARFRMRGGIGFYFPW